VGVLSLYSSKIDGFNDDHRRIVEVVRHPVACTLSGAAEFDSLLRRDATTRLPHIGQLEHLIHGEAADGTFGNVRYSLLFIDVTNLSQVEKDHKLPKEDVLRHVVSRIQQGLRFADILFEHSNGRFVAFLNQTDRHSGDLVGDRIRESLKKSPILLSDGGRAIIQATVTCVCAHVDGTSLAELEAAAEMSHVPTRERASVH
jgi:GGDEF domain-containing protein